MASNCTMIALSLRSEIHFISVLFYYSESYSYNRNDLKERTICTNYWLYCSCIMSDNLFPYLLLHDYCGNQREPYADKTPINFLNYFLDSLLSIYTFII